MKLVTDKEGDYPFLWHWLAARTGLPWSSDMRTIGLTKDDGTIISVCAFCSFLHGKQCFIHFAADEPISRKYIKAIFHYMFVQAQMKSVLGLFDSNNTAIHKFVERIGFQFKVGLEGGLLYEMTPDICKWIDHGKKERSSAAA